MNERISPSAPYYLFEKTDEEGRREFDGLWSISAIFPVGVTGIVTARDRLVSAHTDAELQRKIEEFLDLSISDNEIRNRYKVGDNYQWKLSTVRTDMKDESFDKGRINTIHYHPFDTRRLYNDDRLVFRPRTSVMSLLSQGNIGLVTTRMTKDDGCVFCVDAPIGHKVASSYDLSYLYPLHISGSAENLAPAFRAFIDDLYHHHYAPEEILGYIYAVLHAPTYRRRYAEFLRIDFPRIPFPESRSDFDALSKLGWELVQTHLLKKVPPPPAGRLGEYHGRGDHAVDEVRYSAEEQAVWINEKQAFSPVPQEVWDFHIGGYQVLDKYLKSRKGRTLSLDEQTHVRDVTEALAFTIAQMARIDAAYRAAFPDGDKSAPPLA